MSEYEEKFNRKCSKKNESYLPNPITVKFSASTSLTSKTLTFSSSSFKRACKVFINFLSSVKVLEANGFDFWSDKEEKPSVWICKVTRAMTRMRNEAENDGMSVLLIE